MTALIHCLLFYPLLLKLLISLSLLNSEKKFQDIYNFDVPSEYKTRDIVFLLVFTVLLEEMRLNKLLPENYLWFLRV